MEGVSKVRRSCRIPSLRGGISTVEATASASASSSGVDPRREGSSTGTLEDWGAGAFFLLRRSAWEGNAPSNDCQGSGG